MVDLVKIRKKAKESRESAAAAAEAERGAASAARPEAAAPEEKQPAAAPKKKSRSADVPVRSDRTSSSDRASDASGERSSDRSSQTAITAGRGRPAAADEDVRTPSEPAADAQPKRSTKLDRFKEQAGRLRDQADVAGATVEAGQEIAHDERLEVLTFSIAGENYAVDIEHIVEIVPLRTATRVPNADPSVIGILSLRGTIVTLVDVRRRLKHARSGPTPDSRIVVVEHGGETVGFEVDQVFRVVKIDGGEIEAHPVVHTSELDDSIRGVFRQGESLTILLDFDKLLDRREKPRSGAVASFASPA